MKRLTPLKNKADKLFSEWIRRDGKCEYCNRANVRLECAHIFSRRYISTRYEPINALCLCSAHHRWLHDQPIEGVEWIKNYLGEDIYDELRRKAKTKIVKATDLFYQETITAIREGLPPYRRENVR